MSTKFRGLWPLPGGVDSYFASLKEILAFIQEKQPDNEGLETFIARQYDVSGVAAMKGYVRVLGALGFANVGGPDVTLTPAGHQLLESQRAEDVYRALDTRFIGISETLLVCADHPLSVREIHDRLTGVLGVNWQTTNQTFFRTCWLRSLGMIRKGDDGRYLLTEAGESISRHLPPLAAACTAQPIPLREVEAPSSHPENEQPGLFQRIISSAQEGGSGRSFEVAIRDAFLELGFEARHVGGASEPDVVIEGRQGTSTFRAVVDGKSTGRGVVPDNQINWDSILDHKKQVRATAAVIVAREFAGGNLEDRAVGKGVRLLRVEQLLELLRNHEVTPLGVDVIAPLLTLGGSVSDDEIEALAQRAEELGTWPGVIARVYRTVWERQGESRARLDTNALFFLLGEEFDSAQIREAVEFLSSGIVRAIAKDPEGRLRTLCAPQILQRRLSKLNEALNAVGSEPAT